MGSCRTNLTFYVSPLKSKMIRKIDLAILLITIGFSTARPSGKKTGPGSYPYAPAEPVEYGYKRPPVSEAAYKKAKTHREARHGPVAPVGVAGPPAAPVAEAAYKKGKGFREARGRKAPLGVAGPPVPAHYAHRWTRIGTR